MAIANGYTTLMLREETKELYYMTKRRVEEQLGISLTHSQCVEYMCKHMASPRLVKLSKKPAVLSDSTTK